MSETQQTPPNSTNSSKNNNGLYMAIAGVVGLVIVVGVAAASMSGNKKTDNTQAKSSVGSSLVTQTSTAASLATPVNNSVATATSTATTSTNASGQTAAVTPSNTGSTDPAATQERKVLDQSLELLANEESKFDPMSVTKEQAANNPLVASTEAAAGKTYKVSLNYAHAGDVDFEAATLKVTFDKNLKVNTASMKDSFNGTGEKQVAPSVYDESGNSISYGPGSGDKATSVVKVAQKGALQVEVSVPDGTAPGSYRVVSRLVESTTGREGPAAVFFIDVK